MNWYNKDTRTNLLLAYKKSEHQVFAQLVKDSLSSSDYSIDFIPENRTISLRATDRQILICVDFESTIEFSRFDKKVCLFAQSPYEMIEASTDSLNEKKTLFLDLHNSLSRSKRVVALSDSCRINIQRFHAKHIYFSNLPATYSNVISDLPPDGIAIVINECDVDLCNDLLANFRIFNPVLYLSQSASNATIDALAIRLPSAGLIPVRPKVQIYLGADNSECTPLRIIDAAAAGAVVVQIGYDGAKWERGRRMPTDCIGFFNYERKDSDFAELNAFITHLLNNQIFFDSVLAAQRRYLPDYQSNKNHFYELLTK